MGELSLGKQRRMALLADYDGRIQLLSATGEAAVAVAAALSTQASAVLLSAADDVAGAVAVIDRGAAFLIELAGPADGDVAAVGEWSVARAARAGASGVVVRVGWPLAADEDAAVGAALAQLGDECAKHELPLAIWVDPADAADVVTAAARWSSDELQADLLILPGPSTAADALGLREQLDAAGGLPWIAAGAGAADDWLATLPAAAAAGAAGFCCAGASWRALPTEPDERDAWLADLGLHHWRCAVALSGRARPWSEPRLAGQP